MIKYQDKIIDWVNNQSFTTMPKTLLIEGEEGSGKHSIVDYISNKFDIPIVDITDSISLDVINNAYLEVLPKIYLIDADKITEKNENTLLKFLEEPPHCGNIILLCESQNRLLETIVNRCYVVTIHPYTMDMLREFNTCDDSIELRMSIANTPGKIIKLNNYNLSEMISLCNLIIDKISVASIPNTLTLSDKIAFKGETDKFDFDMFVKLLVNIYFSKIVDNSVKSSIILLMVKLINDATVKNVDKKILFENFLLNLRRGMRNDH